MTCIGFIYYLYKEFIFCLILFLRRNKTKINLNITFNTIFNPFKTLTNKFNIMTPQEKEIIYLPIKTTKDSFTIGGCGKFNEDKKHLSKTEAIYLYAELHKWIFAEEKTETENIYLNRLKEQYREIFKFEKWSEFRRERQNDYDAMRLFCLDTQLISFNDIELMENEVNQSFS